MQGCETAELVDGPFDGGIDPRGVHEPPSAVYDPVPHQLDVAIRDPEAVECGGEGGPGFRAGDHFSRTARAHGHRRRLHFHQNNHHKMSRHRFRRHRRHRRCP